jgi:hypothetical protein
MSRKQASSTTADALHPVYAGPGNAVAALPQGAALHDPWYSDDRQSVECGLSGNATDALWPLSPHPLAAVDACPTDRELCICRRCAEAIRPPATAPLIHRTTLMEQQ